jgi:hypothetical protein
MTGLARATGTAAFQGDPNRAVMKVEMSAITCREFMNYSYDKIVLIGAWMSGYWNAQRNNETLDIARYRANSKRVSNYCKAHGRTPLLSAIEIVAR